MLLPVLTMGHAALGLAVLVHGALSRRGRDAVARVAAAGGIACSATIFLLRSEGLQWRTLDPDATSAVIVAVTTGCAWLLVAALDLGRERAITAGLVGAASSSVILFGLNRWVVPALLFGLCAAGAQMALVVRADRRWAAGAAVLGSAALLAGSLGSHVAASGSWGLPAAAGGLPAWLAIAAALVGSGALGAVGPWPLAGSPAAPAMPLLAGMAFATAAAVGVPAAPWAAACLLGACGAASLHTLATHRVRFAIVGAIPMLAALAVMLAAPRSAAIPAVAGILGVAALALRPPDGWVGATARVALVVPVPATITFAALISGSFERAVASRGLLESAPWTAVAALIPVVLATGLMFGVRALRTGRTTSPGIALRLLDGPAVAAGALLIVSMALAATTRAGAVLGTSLDEGTAVYAGGVALAAGAAFATRRRNARQPMMDRAPEPFIVERAGWVPNPRWRRPAAVAAWATAGALVAGAMWLTFEGLRTGFL